MRAYIFESLETLGTYSETCSAGYFDRLLIQVDSLGMSMCIHRPFSSFLIHAASWPSTLLLLASKLSSVAQLVTSTILRQGAADRDQL